MIPATPGDDCTFDFFFIPCATKVWRSFSPSFYYYYLWMEILLKEKLRKFFMRVESKKEENDVEMVF